MALIFNECRLSAPQRIRTPLLSCQRTARSVLHYVAGLRGHIAGTDDSKRFQRGGDICRPRHLGPRIRLGRLQRHGRDGKVLVFFTNEPPSTDPKFFGGPALTYYGRWTYKFEEATRRGAVAAIHHSHDPDRGIWVGSRSGLRTAVNIRKKSLNPASTDLNSPAG